MQTTYEQLEGLARKFTIEIPAQRVEEEVEKAMRAARPNLKAPGFRKGKVPPEIIKQKYGAEIRRDAVGDLISKTFFEALVEQKLDAAAQPDIELISGLVDGETLKYIAIFEVIPEVKEVRGLDSLEIDLPKTEINEADVETMLNTLRRQQATYIDAPQKTTADDDRVTVDFVGRVDGVEFDGGKGSDVQILIGAGQMLPDFEDGLRNAKLGEEKTFDVKFPENYAEHLAGKTAQFTVVTKKIETIQLPELNDEFIKRFGFDNVEAFRKSVRENMERELNNAVRRIKRERLFNAVLEANNEQEVAQGQIKQEVDRIARSVNLEKQIPDAKTRAEIAQGAFAETARRNVIAGMIFSKLFRDNNIELDQARYDERLQSIAATYEKPAEVLNYYRTNAEARSNLENTILEEQLVDKLYEKVRVNYETKTFQELMAINSQLSR